MERKKINKNIGELSGRLLVFGGVYSNVPALEKMKSIAEAENILPTNIICTGDVVGYCAEPELGVRQIIDWGVHVVAGNVEIQLREGEEDCGCDFRTGSRCDVFSRQWYPYAKRKLSERSIQWMASLPDFIQFQYGRLNGLVVHGSWFETAEYIFDSTPWTVKQKNFDATGADLIFSGHSGLPFSTIRQGKYWLNPGVIGMPANDGTSRVWYMIVEPEKQELRAQHFSMEYDFEKAARLMKEHQLPQEYALTLKTGIWDDCEILPPAETALQGVPIVFPTTPGETPYSV